MEANERDRLRQMLLDRSMRFGEFVLSSGATSNFYIDVRKTSLHPDGLQLISKLFWEVLKDDKVTAIGEYAAYVLYKEKGAEVGFVAPADGLPATPLLVGMVSKAPHPEAAKLFVDWAMSSRGQAFYQDNPNLIYGSLRKDAAPMRTGERLRDFKLLSPEDYADYMASRDQFTKEWNGMLGL